MRIFISHSIKNEKIVLKFAEFLESINSEIEVFCSSEKGSIGTGKNFVKTIFDELDACMKAMGKITFFRMRCIR